MSRVYRDPEENLAHPLHLLHFFTRYQMMGVAHYWLGVPSHKFNLPRDKQAAGILPRDQQAAGILPRDQQAAGITAS